MVVDYSKWDRFDDEPPAVAATDPIVHSEQGRQILARMPDDDPQAWGRGLSDVERYAWLRCCYATRLQETKRIVDGLDVARDILVFCRLAKQTGHVPSTWDWAAFLKAFDQAPSTDDKKLSFTARGIYLSSARAPPSPVELRTRALCRTAFTDNEAPQLFDMVGGRAAWHSYFMS